MSARHSDLHDCLLTIIFSLLLCLQNPILFDFPLFREGKSKPSSMVHTNQSCLSHSFAPVIGLGIGMWHTSSQRVEKQVCWMTSEKGFLTCTKGNHRKRPSPHVVNYQHGSSDIWNGDSHLETKTTPLKMAEQGTQKESESLVTFHLSFLLLVQDTLTNTLWFELKM